MNPARSAYRAHSLRRRGTAAIAVVIALCLLQIAVAGMVLGGGRDHDLTTRRLDTVRAFYAAEAGANMAVREITLNTDADGDGAIGSVSADGNPINNPTLGSGAARVEVQRTTEGAATVITSRGHCGGSIRVIRITVQ